MVSVVVLQAQAHLPVLDPPQVIQSKDGHPDHLDHLQELTILNNLLVQEQLLQSQRSPSQSLQSILVVLTQVKSSQQGQTISQQEEVLGVGDGLFQNQDRVMRILSKYLRVILEEGGLWLQSQHRIILLQLDRGVTTPIMDQETTITLDQATTKVRPTTKDSATTEDQVTTKDQVITKDHLSTEDQLIIKDQVIRDQGTTKECLGQGITLAVTPKVSNHMEQELQGMEQTGGPISIME